MVRHSFFFFFFKQKTAYEMRISDWSSDVCSSDLDLDEPHDCPQVLGVEVHRCPGQCEALLGAPGDHRCVTTGLGRPVLQPLSFVPRSEERRVGKECVSPCSSRWSPYH